MRLHAVMHAADAARRFFDDGDVRTAWRVRLLCLLGDTAEAMVAGHHLSGLLDRVRTHTEHLRKRYPTIRDRIVALERARKKKISPLKRRGTKAHR